MSCESYKLLIGSYVDGELLGAARDEIESHLGACPQCTALAEEFRLLDEAAASEEVPHVTGEEWTLVWDRVRRRDAVPAGAIRLPWRRQAIRWSLAAAAALLIFALGAVVGRGWLPAPEEAADRLRERSARSPAAVETEKDAAAERRAAPPPAVIPETGAIPPSFSSL